MEESLKKRYFFKLISSFLTLGFALITQSIILRSLGPEQYGNFAFLTSVLTPFLLFLDFGNTTPFFVKLSQRPKENSLVLFYFYFTILGIICFLILLFGIMFIPVLRNLTFPNQNLNYIIFAILLAILARILQILNNIVDAYGLTVISEKVQIIQKITSLIIILIIFYLKILDLRNFYLYNIFSTILLISIFTFVIKRSDIYKLKSLILTKFSKIRYSIEFYKYSRPLFIGSLIGFSSNFIDRWLLQFFGGSIQQGYYGFSFQLSTIATLFSSAMSMLIMREFSIESFNKDYKKMAYLFRRYIPLFYSLAAFISCFIIIQSNHLIELLGGDKYEDSLLCFIIISFYPIHQTYGQLSGSVMLATGQSKLYANLGILSVIIGLPISYFLITNHRFWGLNLGAAGLAFKTIIVQVISVNIQLYYNSKLLKLNFLKYLIHQILVILILLCLAFISTTIVNNFIKLTDNNIFLIFETGIIYVLSVVILIFLKPAIFSLYNSDLTFFYNKFKKINFFK